jgi:hypothetical protein
MHTCPDCGKDCECGCDGNVEFCTHWMTAGCRPEDLETNLPEEESEND